MKDFAGKVAFVSGAASGIGLALAEALGRAGMKVMIADINAAELTDARDRLRSSGITAESIVLDVSSRKEMQAAALATIAHYGKVHVCCNNAGVGVVGMMGTVAERDWDWIIDVNLKGIINGMEVFTPLILSHGEGGHIVNTSSMAGLVTTPGREPYNMTKHAIVAMSEGWRGQLGPQGVGVSVLCPSAVRTRIGESERNKPARYAGKAAPDPARAPVPNVFGHMMEPETLAARVLEAIRDDELYIITHPELKAQAEERFQRILAAFDTAADSPALKAAAAEEQGTS
jgi:NAD(P)-dependent dehydrogenase (short-subunit alcohol dehydrogenase family)